MLTWIPAHRTALLIESDYKQIPHPYIPPGIFYLIATSLVLLGFLNAALAMHLCQASLPPRVPTTAVSADPRFPKHRTGPAQQRAPHGGAGVHGHGGLPSPRVGAPTAHAPRPAAATAVGDDDAVPLADQDAPPPRGHAGGPRRDVLAWQYKHK
jgi:hypothetical protein